METNTILILGKVNGCQVVITRHLFLGYSGSWYGKLRQESEMDPCAARLIWSNRGLRVWRRILLSKANCTLSSVITKEIVNCHWTFSFTFPFHLSRSNLLSMIASKHGLVVQRSFFQLVFKIVCFFDWLVRLTTEIQKWRHGRHHRVKNKTSDF